MEEEYPRLLVERDVVVTRDGKPGQARLRGWLDGYDGPVPTYRIELIARDGSYSCTYTATASDIFEALVRLRRQLEPDGLMIAVQGRGVIPTRAAWRGIWAAEWSSTSCGLEDAPARRTWYRLSMTHRPTRSRPWTSSGHSPGHSKPIKAVTDRAGAGSIPMSSFVDAVESVVTQGLAPGRGCASWHVCCRRADLLERL